MGIFDFFKKKENVDISWKPKVEILVYDSQKNYKKKVHVTLKILQKIVIQFIQVSMNGNEILLLQMEIQNLK